MRLTNSIRRYKNNCYWMSSDKILIESLAELKWEIPHLNPIGYSYREFNRESNNIQQAQANTIVKLLVKINNRL